MTRLKHLCFASALLSAVLGAGQTAALARTAASGAGAQQTRRVLQRFVAAYNAHDAGAVLALTTQHVRYIDCDYAHHLTRDLRGRRALSRWLRAQFRAHDAWRVTRVLAGGWQNDTYDPRAFGILGTRDNAAIRALGLPPQGISGAKGVLNRSGTRINFLLVADCSGMKTTGG